MATLFVSPGQREAQATPPPASAVTATVELGDLTDERVMAGTVEYAGEQTRLLSAPTDGERAVVTAVQAHEGDAVQAGAHVLSLNDEPVFLIQAPFDFYRDLHRGDTGSDVRALQTTLSRLGLGGAVDGVFGPATAAGIDELYGRAGTVAPRDVVEPSRSPEQPETANPSDNGERADVTSPAPPITETFLPLSAVVTADNATTVIRRLPAVGDLIDASTGVTVAASDLVIEATLLSGASRADLLGEQVRVDVDGAGSFRGVVESPPSSPSATPAEEGGDVADATDDVIIVRPSDPKDAQALRPGATATVTLSIATLATDALIAPRSAVTEGSGDAAWLYVETDDGFMEVPIRILAQLGGRVAIESDDPSVVVGAKVRIG